MARVKPKKNMIQTKAQAEDAMARINFIDRQLTEWDLKEAYAVAQIRRQFADLRKKANCAGMEAEKALLVKELEIWAEADAPTWGKKTYETPFGSMGFRISNPSVVLVKKVVKNFQQALGWLKSDGRMEYVRTVEEVNKDAILADFAKKTLDEEALLQCGLKVKQEDEFWVESKASKDLEEAVKKLRAA